MHCNSQTFTARWHGRPHLMYYISQAHKGTQRGDTAVLVQCITLAKRTEAHSAMTQQTSLMYYIGQAHRGSQRGDTTGLVRDFHPSMYLEQGISTFTNFPHQNTEICISLNHTGSYINSMPIPWRRQWVMFIFCQHFQCHRVTNGISFIHKIWRSLNLNLFFQLFQWYSILSPISQSDITFLVINIIHHLTSTVMDDCYIQ